MAEKQSGAPAIWSGTLTFGLVSVPVRLFPAVRRRGVHLHMLDEDGTPLSRRYFCSEEDKPLKVETRETEPVVDLMTVLKENLARAS